MKHADLLREASRLMRERATAATPSPWKATSNSSIEASAGFRGRVVASVGAYESGWPSAADAQHIASWHPIVAVAVAEWLEDEADRIDDTPYPVDGDWIERNYRAPLAVARFYVAPPVPSSPEETPRDA